MPSKSTLAKMQWFLEMPVGMRFSRLVTIAPPFKSKTTMVQTICDCGELSTVAVTQLMQGKTRSCGCLIADTVIKRSTKHGLKPRGSKATPEYASWIAMKARCASPGTVHYERDKNSYYRTLTVCERWLNSFENFLEDMGQRPPGTSLDRIDNSKGYFPENCRWADAKTQSKNQRPRKKRSTK